MARNAVTPQQRSCVIILPLPLTTVDRVVCDAPFAPHETLGAYVRRLRLRIPDRFIVLHNGYLVPQALWHRLIPRPGDVVTIRCVPGFGGGFGGIIRTFAMIAVIAFAPTLAGYLAPMLGISTAAGSVGLSLLTAGIGLGGVLLVNSVFPAPKLTLGGSGLSLSNRAKYTQSPTYSISGGSNRARQYEPIPLIFGRVKLVPDISARPYSSYAANSVQTYYQVFTLHVKVPGVKVTSSFWRIGTTDLASFAGASLGYAGGNVNEPVGRLPAEYSSNVGVDAGFDLSSTTDVIRTVPADTVSVTLSYRVLSYTVDKNTGVYSNDNLVFSIATRPNSSTAWTTVQYTVHGNLQNPMTGNIVVTAAVPGGDIKVSRVTPLGTDPYSNHQIIVLQLKYVKTDPAAAYSMQARYGLAVPSSAATVGSLDVFSVIASGWAPVRTKNMVGGAWDGTYNWSTVAETGNPAWWFHWFAVGYVDPVLGRIFGCGLTEDQIDSDSLSAWAQYCDDHGLAFNYVLDQEMSCGDVLRMIATAGFASVTFQTGKLGVVWDAADLPIAAIITPWNIKAGTFSVGYVDASKMADEFVVNFDDSAADYTLGQVRVSVPPADGSGSRTIQNSVQVSLDGCTDKTMAGKYANLLAAAQVIRRRTVSFEMDFERLTFRRGDAIQCSHDLTSWGYSSRLAGRDGSTLYLLQQIPQEPGIGMIRDPEGTNLIVNVVPGSGAGPFTTTVIVTSDTSSILLPGDAGTEYQPMDWIFLFAPAETPGKRLKVLSVSPTPDAGARITATDDDPAYYAAEDGDFDYVPTNNGAVVPAQVLAVSIAERYYNSRTGELDVVVTWTLTDQVPVSVVTGVNGVEAAARTVSDPYLVLTGLHDGDVVSVRIMPSQLLINREMLPFTATHTVSATMLPPGDVTGVVFAMTNGQPRLSWNAVGTPDVVAYEVRSADTGWGDANYIYKGSDTSCVVATLAAPGTLNTWYVRALTAGGLYSGQAAAQVGSIPGSITGPAGTGSYTVNAVQKPVGLQSTFSQGTTQPTIDISWDPVAPVVGLGYYLVTDGTTSTKTVNPSIRLDVNWDGVKTFSVYTVDALGNQSAAAQLQVTKNAPNPVTSARTVVVADRVQISWSAPAPAPTTTLPVSTYEVFRGDTWAGAVSILITGATFAYWPENRPGNYTYWVVSRDVTGTRSTPVQFPVAVVGEAAGFKVWKTIASSGVGGFNIVGPSIPGGAATQTRIAFGGSGASSLAGWYTQKTRFRVNTRPTQESASDSQRAIGSVRATADATAGSQYVILFSGLDGVANLRPHQMGETSPWNYLQVYLWAQAVGGSAHLDEVSVDILVKMERESGTVACSAADADGTIVNLAGRPFAVDSCTAITSDGSTAATVSAKAIGQHPPSSGYAFQSGASGSPPTSGDANKFYTIDATHLMIAGTGFVAGERVWLLPDDGVDVGIYQPDVIEATVTAAYAAAGSVPAYALVTLDRAPASSPWQLNGICVFSKAVRLKAFDTTGTRTSVAVFWSADYKSFE